MRNVLWVAFMLAAAACQKAKPSADERYGDASAIGHVGRSAGYLVTEHSPEFRQRADSLERLDPSHEASIAILAGDVRYLAVCRLACVPIGIPGDTVCLIQGCVNPDPADVRPLSGSNVPPMNGDVARFDSVAAKFGASYNSVIREYRKRRGAARRAS
ncbi:MAG TPA: hypothetical protein VK636_12655 [Gemmatimonadaceae bacterium]|nr:hypothetical protein [Gemmatimonadaceae bacterium]